MDPLAYGWGGGLCGLDSLGGICDNATFFRDNATFLGATFFFAIMPLFFRDNHHGLTEFCQNFTDSGRFWGFQIFQNFQNLRKSVQILDRFFQNFQNSGNSEKSGKI